MRRERMFGLLKNKLSSFIKGLTGREEKKEAPQEKPKPGFGGQLEPGEERPKQGERQEETRPEPKAGGKMQPPTMEEKKPANPREGKPGEKAGRKLPAAQETTHGEKEERGLGKGKPIGEKAGRKTGPASIRDEKKHVPLAPMKAETPKPTQKIQLQTGISQEQKPVVLPPAVAVGKKQAEAQNPAVLPPEKPAEKKPAEAQAQPETAEQPKKSLLDSVVGVFSGKKADAQKPEAKSDETAAQPHPPDLSHLERKASSAHREIAPRIGIGTAVKSLFSSEITICESDVSDMLEELELSLLEADVAYEVSSEVSSQLKNRLIGMKVQKSQVEPKIKETVKSVLESVMESDRKFDFLEKVKSLPRPVKILFVGPNGAGKTTTMAKVARMLMDAGLTAVFSASDTFRAAAIEQTEVHAGRLGVKVVKSKYGADPASVAFDAVNFARANAIDVVLIDSAGRQDTNANLLSELKKISRISKPDLKIYIGESIGGNSIIEQIRAFNEAIGVDGAILTKLDCDAKGGTAISIAKSTGIPVIFLGVGQGYSDLLPFDAEKIAREIMS